MVSCLSFVFFCVLIPIYWNRSLGIFISHKVLQKQTRFCKQRKKPKRRRRRRKKNLKNGKYKKDALLKTRNDFFFLIYLFTTQRENAIRDSVFFFFFFKLGLNKNTFVLGRDVFFHRRETSHTHTHARLHTKEAPRKDFNSLIKN